MKYACFHYDPIGPSTFFYTDDQGQPRETQFNITEPANLVEAVSAAIQFGNIDHVTCNEPGLGLSSAIKQYLLTHFNQYNCEFELNK